MLNVDHLTKRYGTVTAIDGLSFEVGPGRVTGFLGPNGAGKTTLRVLLGLAAPNSGTATINGVRYRDLQNPVRSVGAALEADCLEPTPQPYGRIPPPGSRRQGPPAPGWTARSPAGGAR